MYYREYHAKNSNQKEIILYTSSMEKLQEIHKGLNWQYNHNSKGANVSIINAAVSFTIMLMSKKGLPGQMYQDMAITRYTPLEKMSEIFDLAINLNQGCYWFAGAFFLLSAVDVWRHSMQKFDFQEDVITLEKRLEELSKKDHSPKI